MGANVNIKGRMYVVLPIGMVEEIFQSIYDKNSYDKKFINELTNLVKKTFKFSYKHNHYPNNILLTKKVISYLQDMYDNDRLL